MSRLMKKLCICSTLMCFVPPLFGQEAAPDLPAKDVAELKAPQVPTGEGATENPFGDGGSDEGGTAPLQPGLDTEPPDLAPSVAQSERLVANLQQAIRLTEQLNAMLGVNTGSHGVFAGAAGTDDNIARKVHAVVMADNRVLSGGVANEIRAGATANADNIAALLRSQCKVVRGGVVENHLEEPLRTLEGNDFSFRQLRQTVDSMDVREEDVIFVYIACHGLTFTGRKHGFQMPPPGGNERILRESVWNLIKAKGARLTVLISDSCANGFNELPPPVTVSSVGDVSNAFAALLLYSRGDVDINGSSRPPADIGDGSRSGQFGLYDTRGGWFTKDFIAAAKTTPLPVSWNSLFDQAQSSLSGRFPSGGIPVKVGTQTRRVFKQTIELIDD